MDSEQNCEEMSPHLCLVNLDFSPLQKDGRPLLEWDVSDSLEGFIRDIELRSLIAAVLSLGWKLPRT